MKNKLQKILCASAFILLGSMTSNGQWTSIARVYGGTIANDGAVSFAIGDKGYIASGSSTGTMYKYDTLANSWSMVGNVPAGMGHAFAMSFVINGKAYVVGGDTSGIPVNSVWEFDPSQTANPWIQKNDFPPGIRDGGFGFSLNNYGYVGAGNDNVGLYNDIWKYNPDSDSWTLLPVTLPVTGLIFPTSFVIGNKGYILTGGIPPFGVSELTDMWCLDGANDSLSVKANFLGAGRQAAFAFSNNVYGYVGGGQSNYTINYSDMWIYDPVNDQWSPGPNVPLFGTGWSSTFVIGNMAYAGLGAKFVGAGLSGDDIFHKLNMDLVIPTGMGTSGEIKNDWVLYPNPANDKLYLSGEISTSSKITVTDLTGRVVLELETIPADRTIPVADLSTGVYTLRIAEKDLITCKRFVRN